MTTANAVETDTTHLSAAMRQWATRPDDERFWDTEEMLAALAKRRANSKEELVKPSQLVAEGDGDEFKIKGPGGTELDPTNWAMRQLGTRLGVGTDIFGKVSGETAAGIFNDRIERMDPEDEINLLIQQSKDEGVPSQVRAVLSSGYARVWDADIVQYAQLLIKQQGFKVPPARLAIEGGRSRIATEADVLSANNRPTGGPSIQVGDTIGPAGLYAGDRDMFMTLVRDDLAITDPMGNPLNMGLMISNSEVGAKKFSVTQFMFRGVCGNHCFWNCTDIIQARYRHVGAAEDRVKAFLNQVVVNGIKFTNPEQDQKVVDWMARITLGPDKAEVVDAIYGWRMSPQILTKKVLGAIYDEGEKWADVDGAPNTWWGYLQAMTRYSQTFPNADQRLALDMAAAELYARATKEVAKG